MARIRSVKPEFWDDRKLAKRTTRDARLLYIALWNLADEHARLNGDPQWIKGQVFPYDDDLDIPAVEALIKELAALQRVLMYEADGDPYLFLPKLAQHQRLEPEKVRSRIPDPPPPGSPNGSSESRALPSEPCADLSERGADESEQDADKPALLYVAGSMEHVAGGDARERARDPAAATRTANSLLDEHRRLTSPSIPRDVTRRIGEQIDSLLDDPDIAVDEIREGLTRLRSNRKWGPGMLPNLVHEVRQERAGTGQPRARSPDPRPQAPDNAWMRRTRTHPKGQS